MIASQEVLKSLDEYPDTPMMRQFKVFKSQYPEDIIFFRLGDFYEMFGHDAVLVSSELGLTLTGRGKGDQRVPMCGVPHHAAQTYLAKLVDKGFRVEKISLAGTTFSDRSLPDRTAHSPAV